MTPPIRYASFVSVVVLVLVASPVIQNWHKEPQDGFPLSYFPMFTTDRKGRTTLIHPVGLLADGAVEDLPYTVAGRGGMNKVRRQINRRVRDGDADELCERIARTVRDRGKKKYIAVGLVEDLYEFERWFAHDRTPTSREWIARRALDEEE